MSACHYMVNITVITSTHYRAAHHQQVAQRVGGVLSVHPSPGSCSHSEWFELHQGEPVKLPPPPPLPVLPPLQAPTLGEHVGAPLHAVVGDAQTVVLNSVVVIVVVHPAVAVVLDVDVFIPPRSWFEFRGDLISDSLVVPIFKPERSGLVGPHGVLSSPTDFEIFLTA